MGKHAFIEEISEDKVLRNIGYTSKQKSSFRTKKNIGSAIQMVKEIIEVKSVHRILPLNKKNNFIHINGSTTINSRKISGALEKCDKIAVFIVTLGQAVDNIISKTQSTNLQLSFIIDSVASLAVELGADFIQNSMRNELDSYENMTVRYSPGYCDWPLKEQEKIFSLLPLNPAGIHLSKNCLMSPKKSISCIAGIGKSSFIKNNGNACYNCNNINCIYRRT